jgi:hypothetical protein
LWKPGEYRRGDTVTRDGSLWICDVDTTTGEPDMPGQTGWRLAAKKGRDGLDGKRGDRGERGQKGERGQDAFLRPGA